MPTPDTALIRDTQHGRLLVDDMYATLAEGVIGWLDRYASCNAGRTTVCGPAGGVMVLAARLVPSVARICDDWNLEVRVRSGEAGARVLIVSGPVLPVRALCATVEALRYHRVTAH